MMIKLVLSLLISFPTILAWVSSSSSSSTFLLPSTMVSFSLFRRNMMYDKNIYNEYDNPLWPIGISENDIDLLVDEVLDDPNLNIQSIPDNMERHIYCTTIRLCLNTVYQSLSYLHNKKFIGHKLKITRWRRNYNYNNNNNKKQATTATTRLIMLSRNETSNNIDDNVLEEIATGLLKNKAINQRFLPDAIEKKIYTNCLKLIFRLLSVIASSFRLTVCGHEIKLEISKASSRKAIIQPAMKRAMISMKAIKRNRMNELAKAAGYNDDMILLPDDLEQELKIKKGGWFIINFYKRRRRKFLVKLHATLYGLLLGIIDDLLAHTTIEFLSDLVSMDLVPIDPGDVVDQ